MNSSSDHILKGTDNRHRYRSRVKAKSKRRIRDSDSNKDLVDRINALQRAVANSRSENERFRQEVLTKMRLLLERGTC